VRHKGIKNGAVPSRSTSPSPRRSGLRAVHLPHNCSNYLREQNSIVFGQIELTEKRAQKDWNASDEMNSMR